MSVVNRNCSHPFSEVAEKVEGLVAPLRSSAEKIIYHRQSRLTGRLSFLHDSCSSGAQKVLPHSNGHHPTQMINTAL